MALFPAYELQKVSSDVESENGVNSECWLNNSSFLQDLWIPNEPTKRKLDSAGEQIVQHKDSLPESFRVNNLKNVEKVKRKKSQKPEKNVSTSKNEFFIMEYKGSREFLRVNTISWPAAPKYKVSFNLCLQLRKNKAQKFCRYFESLIDMEVKDDSLLNTSKKDIGNANEHFTGFIQEEELSQKTASFNQHLAQYPCDIKHWLDYVKFQDVKYQFEKTYRKGSIAKAQRVLAERKLSILDKACIHNPNCELLDRERLNVATNAFPADELQIYLKNLVDRDRGNIIFWQGYIEAIQCSMSHCTTPSVIELYTKCLSTLHQLRRATALEKHLMEECILKMLYQCGLFLKQAGLFEQMWTLLKMYLELNLSPTEKNKFDIPSEFNEKQLVDLEDVILTSRLPLHELWLRIEKLRESCHWLPYLGDENCEDPQRLVFPEDVAELIHPITTPENIFKLTATIFSLLKIPLLPCRHTIMQDLGLDYVPWSLDSIEPLLSMYFPLYPLKVNDENIFRDLRLAVGPQYLKTVPGQEEYLNFVLKVMKSCWECLADNDKFAITIWWFRFQRVLIILDKKRHIKLSDHMKKQIKKNLKDVLKMSENRSNVLYYLEYALLEKELGNVNGCMNIINTALKMGENVSFKSDDWNFSHSIRCYLHRQHVQITLDDEFTDLNKEKASLILSEFVLQKKIDSLSKSIIEDVNNEFKNITVKIIQQGFKNLAPSNNFLPDFSTEWIICNGWFFYLNKDIEAFDIFMCGILKELDENNKNPCLQKEILYEFYVAVLFRHCYHEPCGSTFKLLDKTLYYAIEIYSNNLFFLSVLATKQGFISSFGPPWWKIQNLLLKSDRALCTSFAVIILNQQVSKSQGTYGDAVTDEVNDINIGLKNRLLSLFKKILSSNKITRRCGLLWRLYLQFVYTYYSPEICRNVYYTAVEECPWLKALYIDAAIYIPAELPQIQDLIIEKQLRLHVTPEELDVLRS